ncbi:MAG: phage tail protein [Lewinellaceae bacterium]|nr:phage tail protein [Lewinellaceae bacterium]
MAISNDYPLTKFRFAVDLGDGKDLSFQKVSFGDLNIEKTEYRGGLDPSGYKQQILGLKTAGEITMERGTFAGDNLLFTWWSEPEPGRRTVIVRLLNAKNATVVTWKIKNAVPTKVTSTDLDGESNDIAIEKIVLAHEGFEIENQ